MYINIPFSTLMYIAGLCPNLVTVHFYAIPILHYNFLFTFDVIPEGRFFTL